MPRCFTAHTDTLELAWSTKREHPPGPALHVGHTVLSAPAPPSIDLAPDATVLREEATYTLLIRSQHPVQLSHRHPLFLSGLHRADGGRIWHGTVTFGSQVGYSDLTVLIGGAPAFTLHLEVYPSKVDYQRDYVALRDAIQGLHTDLALDYVQRTYQFGRPSPSEVEGSLGWLFMLRSLVDELAAAVNHIAVRPHQRVLPEAQWRATNQMRAHQAHALLPNLRQQQSAPQRRSFILAQATVYSTALWEHAWLLGSITHQMDQLRTLQPRLPTGSTDVAHLTATLTGVRERLAPIAPPATPTPSGHASVLFERAPGYRDAYRLCTTLERGLALYHGPIPFEVKDLHRLYEYWCYVTVVQTIANTLGITIPASQLIALRHDTLPFQLARGREQTLRFDLGAHGSLALAYNPRYSGPAYLVAQQPDIVLTHTPLSEPATRYILDAKYRLDTSTGYLRHYGAPGPPRDALNDLHRYRDALREHPHPEEHGASQIHVAQALILFPYHDAQEVDFSAGRLWPSITQRGIGALPLLPNHTTYLERWVDALCDALMR